ncbi:MULTISPECIES: hypothetical protein [Streptomyces]
MWVWGARVSWLLLRRKNCGESDRHDHSGRQLATAQRG